MGFDDDDMIFNTGLQLGLGLGLGPHDQSEKYMKTDQRQRQKKREEVDPSTTATTCNKAYPTLTLGPPDNEANNYNNQLTATKNNESDDHEDFHPHDQASSPSAVSSFSNSSASIKRERDLQFVGEEFDVEEDKVPSRAVGDVDENGSPRKKLRLNKEQSAVLEDSFKEHSTLNPKQKQELARKLNLRTRQVEVWFQNRRARTKLKQTEVDCELLKKCYETLTEENKRLQKELQELKSMKTTPPAGPFYMQLPVASVTVCPSCERICGGVGGNGSSPTTALLIGSKAHRHHLYKNNYPFTHSSAAC